MKSTETTITSTSNPVYSGLIGSNKNHLESMDRNNMMVAVMNSNNQRRNSSRKNYVVSNVVNYTRISPNVHPRNKQQVS